jgi:hypothetical protein
MERLLQAQVQEYIDGYYPHSGKVDVIITPDGSFASVRDASSETKTPRTKGRKNRGAMVS